MINRVIIIALYTALGFAAAGSADKKCVVGSEVEMKKQDSNCSKREINYANKMRSKTAVERKRDLERLEVLEKERGHAMPPDWETWMFQRMDILRGLGISGSGDDEL